MADDPAAVAAVADPPAAAAPAEDYKTQLAESIRGEAAFADIPDVATLGQRFLDAHKAFGADKVVIPGKDATDEVKAAFFEKLGRPSKADGYALPTEGMPEGFTPDEAATKQFFEFAHKRGINKQDAAALVRFQAEREFVFNQEVVKADEKAREASLATLGELWGEARDQNMQEAKDGLKRFDGDGEFGKFLEETGLGNDHRLITIFHKIQRAISEDEVLGTGSGTVFVLSPEEAKRQIGLFKIDPDKSSAFLNKHNQGHQAAVGEMDRLHKLAYPEEKK